MADLIEPTEEQTQAAEGFVMTELGCVPGALSTALAFYLARREHKLSVRFTEQAYDVEVQHRDLLKARDDLASVAQTWANKCAEQSARIKELEQTDLGRLAVEAEATRESFKRSRMEMQQHIAKITEQKATAFRRVAELEKEREKLIDDCCRFENANVALVDERKRLTDALAYCFDRRGINFSYDEWAELCVKALGRQPAALGAGNDGPGTLRAEKAETEVARLRVELEGANKAIDRGSAYARSVETTNNTLRHELITIRSDHAMILQRQQAVTVELEATVADLNRQIDEAHRDNARLILESAMLREGGCSNA